ncbi:NMD3-related protein [Caldisphaera sp.]|uniref:NMD3-related protein n=1 Tax=Caldisphaera sp. TaxID=2060322 RepID=UPI0025B8B28B|nr:NMD3-related protein [Caldisphaera sp.]
MPEKICPMCGRSSNEVEFIDKFCKDCFIKHKGLAIIPDKVEFTYCNICGSYKYLGQWTSGLETLEETLDSYLRIYITEKMKPVEPIKDTYIKEIEFIERNQNYIKAKIIIEASYKNLSLSEDKMVIIKLNDTICPTCSSIKTLRGYNAIIQIRGYPNKISESLYNEIKKQINKIATLSRGEIIKVEEIKKDGFDLYIRDNKYAKAIATKLKEEYMAKTIETYKLIGVNKDGSRKSRMYISVRLLNLKPKDIFVYEGQPYIYVSKGLNGILVENLNSREKKIIETENLWNKGFRLYDEETNLKIVKLIEKNNDIYVFSDKESNYTNTYEYREHSIEGLIDDLREGQEFKAYLSKNFIYLMERLYYNT